MDQVFCMFFRVPGRELTIVFHSNRRITDPEKIKIGTSFLEGRKDQAETESST